MKPIEEHARDQQAFAVVRLTTRREIGAEGDVRGDPSEWRLDTLQIAEHRVAEDRVAVACLAARCVARLRSGRREVDQPVGLRHREWP
jgi:hypothetical protein